ncbi:hypothetical protein HZA98_00540 [Candidatus Woesearchaeota archaeon]|nr:hypothetical protein [Candidatus Woesearchaeota archaeon]
MQEKFVMKTMKRVAAIGTGVAMLGATLTGAMALDLKDYPSPFVVNGAYDSTNALVVGDNADAADTLGMVDIATNLQFESKTAVKSDSTSVSVTGGKTNGMTLGLGLSNTTSSGTFDKTLQDDDVTNLFDGTINFQSAEYDTSEELNIDNALSPLVATGLSSSDTNYKADPYLEVTNRKDIKFFYKFDESINLSLASTSQPLEIGFLGNHLKITSVPSTGTSITAYVGDEHYMTVGDTVDVIVDGVTKKVTLQDVSSTSAVVDVDGVSKIISNANTLTVNGVEVTVDDVFSRTERTESSANLILGKQSAETYNDGDAYIGENTDDPNWVWNFQALSTKGTAMNLSIENDFVYNDISSGAVGVGKCIDLPNKYVSICFDSLTVADTDYSTYTFKYESSTDLSDTFLTNTSVPAIHVSTTASEGIELKPYTASATVWPNVTSTIRAKDVWLYLPSGLLPVNGSNISGGDDGYKWIGVFYKDSSTSKVKEFGEINSQNAATEILRINYGNTKDTNLVLYTNRNGASHINMTLNASSDTSGAIFSGYDTLKMTWGLTAANGSLSRLGATASTEEAQELQWSSPTINIGTKDEDERTVYGVIVKHPKSNGASDSVALSVPQDQVKANIVIKGTGSTTASGSTTYIPAAVTPATKLASEIGTASDYNLILVGGPCANSLVSTLFSMTCEGWSFQEGEAVVKLAANGNKVAMLVAGTTASDTRRAAKAVATHGSYTFSGAEVVVSGTSMTDINVKAASA